MSGRERSEMRTRSGELVRVELKDRRGIWEEQGAIWVIRETRDL